MGGQRSDLLNVKTRNKATAGPTGAELSLNQNDANGLEMASHGDLATFQTDVKKSSGASCRAVRQRRAEGD